MKSKITLFLHLFMLLLSLFLIIDISVSTFRDADWAEEPPFLKTQFIICLIFLLDFFIEWAISPRKIHFFFSHLFFLIVSIPYLSIFKYFDVQFSNEMSYFIRFIPLFRGGYAVVAVVGWLSKTRASGLFFSYLSILLSAVYFSTLLFFVFELGKNPGVHSFGDAIWWAFMDVTTIGSNIYPTTVVGKFLSVFLASLGMMTFPIFTVYITNLVQKHQKEEQSTHRLDREK